MVVKDIQSNLDRGTMWLTVVLAAGLAHISFYLAPFEDAYITFRYARHAAQGQGLVFNPGERVEGITSIGWTLLLAGLDRVGLPPHVVAGLLSAAFGMLLLWLTSRLARRWLKERWAGPAAAALLASQGTWAYYAGTGMETTLFSVLVLLAVALAVETGRRAAFCAGLLFALALTVRPEGLGYFLITMLWVASLRRPENAGGLLAGYVPLALLFVASKYLYYGSWLPNTYHAKAEPSWLRVTTGLSHAEQYLTLSGTWLAIAAALFLLGRQRWKPWLRALAAMIAGALANIVLVGGDIFPFFRFALPAMPFVAVLFVAAIVEGRRALGEGRYWSKQFMTVALVLLVAGWSLASAFLPRSTLSGHHGQSHYARVQGIGRLNDDYFRVGRWLRDHFPPDTTIAVNAAGIVPYESGFQTIDMLGLTDAHIGRRIMPRREGAPGHRKHDADYVLSRRPDIIIPGLPILSAQRIQPTQVPLWFGRWVQHLPGDAELLRHPSLSEHYDVASMPVDSPNGQGWLTFFIRRRRLPAPCAVTDDDRAGAASLCRHEFTYTCPPQCPRVI